MKISDPLVISQLNKILDLGFKKIGSYGRDDSIIYLKKDDNVAVPFSLDDHTFNENIEEVENGSCGVAERKGN